MTAVLSTQNGDGQEETARKKERYGKKTRKQWAFVSGNSAPHFQLTFALSCGLTLCVIAIETGERTRVGKRERKKGDLLAYQLTKRDDGSALLTHPTPSYDILRIVPKDGRRKVVIDCDAGRVG